MQFFTIDSRRLRTGLAIGFALLIGDVASSRAQWIHYPTADIPRGADGTPNLSAPTPRTAAGKPDLSGMWGPDATYYHDIEAGGIVVPMRPEARAILDERQASHGRDLPHGRCLPLGMPLMVMWIMKVVQTPAQVTVLYEAESTFRQIFLDGRALPTDPQPTWRGYSVGHWDGDDLIIETIGLNGKGWLDEAGHPLSEALRVTERYRRRDFGHLKVEVTIDDRRFYRRPWTITQEHTLLADDELLEDVCLENEKDAAHLVGK
jgi:hypothetical protein